ncbi:MAG: hypothetical protein ACJA1A_000082 [Saprospiraceae bacterium]|jgi:hypothetical protein|tara:strand:+ start:841 stop:1197 length:357 start_codon:yes stop_codon:yes gene_type:complete
MIIPYFWNMKYSYYDGAGNNYEIKDLKLSYFPIKKEESSSGTYDGGIAYTKELTKLDLVKFVDVFERAIWTEKDHSAKREMGCGTIRKYLMNDLVSQVYLRRNSSSMLEIDKMFVCKT